MLAAVMCLKGNEEADRLAKEGSQLPLGESSSATYAGVKRMIKARKNRQFAEWWEQALPKHKRYQDLGFKSATLKCPRELKLPRATLHHLLASRSGHGDFENYHRRMNHTDQTPCTCGRIKTPEHIVYCRKSRQLRAQWPHIAPEPQPERLLGQACRQPRTLLHSQAVTGSGSSIRSVSPCR